MSKVPTFEFDRYINGVLMAEGVTIERQPTFDKACVRAAELASYGKNGEIPVLVYRGHSFTAEAEKSNQVDEGAPLYDGTVPMADGGDTRMTAAEKVLAWLLIEKIGVPDDVGYSPNQAQEIIVRKLDNLLADAARAQGAEVEPAEWQWRWKNNSCPWHQGRVPNWVKEAGDLVEERPLYTAPPAPQPTDRERVLTSEEKEQVLLRIIEGMGGETDSSEHPGQWLNWFCNDEIAGEESDTFNRCNDKGWLSTTHCTDFDTSTTSLTKEGRAAIAGGEA